MSQDPHLWSESTAPALLAALRATSAKDDALRFAALLETEPTEEVA